MQCVVVVHGGDSGTRNSQDREGYGQDTRRHNAPGCERRQAAHGDLCLGESISEHILYPVTNPRDR